MAVIGWEGKGKGKVGESDIGERAVARERHGCSNTDGMRRTILEHEGAQL